MMKNGDVPVYWVIDFKNIDPENAQTGDPSTGVPPFNLYIPQDSSVLPSRPKKAKGKHKAIDFFRQIQESCDELKEECRETLNRTKDADVEEQISHITDDIKGLFGIIKEFTQLMQKLQPPPPEEPPGQEKNL